MITVGTIVKFIDSGGQKNAGAVVDIQKQMARKESFSILLLELINCIKALNNIEVTPKQ